MPAPTGSSPRTPVATSPSAMPFTSSGCRPQNSAIWSKVRLVFSTSHTAVAFGIRGRSIGYSCGAARIRREYEHRQLGARCGRVKAKPNSPHFAQHGQGRLTVSPWEGRTCNPRSPCSRWPSTISSAPLAFYRDGLGLPTEGIVGQEFDHGAVVFFKLAGGLILALYPSASLAAGSADRRRPTGGWAPSRSATMSARRKRSTR